MASWTAFPPFPSAPSGATIIPFKVFEEHGIQVTVDESGQEVDGIGVPTAVLPIREEPDFDFEWEPYEISVPRGFRLGNRAKGYPPAWNRTDKPKTKEVSELISPDYSDDETGGKRSRKAAPAHIQVSTDPAPNPTRSNNIPVRPPYAYYRIKPVDLDSDEAVRELLELDRLRREERLIDFLEDPEKAVRVFLSSYSRDLSFWWSKDNLDVMPRVLCHFFKFLLKNRVFPDLKDEKKFQNALKVAETGHKELPLTSVIARFLPNPFAKACQEYWGRQGSRDPWSDGEDEGVPNDNLELADVLVSDGAGICSKLTNIKFDECDEEDPDVVVLPQTATVPTSIPKPMPEFLQELLSSTNAFPMSHTVGYVEHSLRRIKQVLPPGTFASSHAKSYKSATEDIPLDSVDAVENELEKKLAKVILIPWTGSQLKENPDPPKILRCPKISPTSVGFGLQDELDEHDPHEDDITVLISLSAKQLNVLKDTIGMGIAGTWVQMRPTGEAGLDTRRLKFWYLEDQDLVVPSFEAC
ncbi:hypothetical protein NP233_g4842 [Leucocoprinus birnbaumii]|uniref:Uncharacterized protein n=1 Tax=Leucocoprinus birnbaumii TaxID=56174 RepID=A0AAD5W0D1_9AGAR|nr:hypothetical protein NP233_g4842 [Leucocoprinus birnbaumii]